MIVYAAVRFRRVDDCRRSDAQRGTGRMPVNQVKFRIELT